ncbi:lipopolysaccharide export system permease protein [Rhodovulum imhoffii]|uniref:Lipopolysaccharide export system permease protein n=1 Tax=Rhodovulum imhoffii TaxID=365340 RepID=A0A2T5BVK6_9RHOB|nr:LPS export ABC transporter permease LptG [Rhodovulum imhoffii]MBK5932818.1 LPS export ABC transporter permease LptG [Rhodovulum imhoffii]PTN03613.1 lipopolysaccharide export system permease protein [Rhodovulum imhoffii]
MILHLYFARKFAAAFFSLAGLFLVFLTLVDMVDQLRRYDGEVSAGEALHLAALTVSGSLYGILPIVVALATLVLFLGLARSSELVVVRASGRSALRSLIGPVATAFIFGVLGVTVLNPIVAGTARQYEKVVAHYRNDTRNVLSISGEGLWLRQGAPGGQTVIRAAQANLDGTRFFNVTFLSFDANGRPSDRIEAAHAVLEQGYWRIEEAKRWPLGVAGANPERDASTHAEITLPSDLTQERIRDSFGTPSAIPVWKLPEFIAALERAGFSTRHHRVWLNMELALPLMFVAMVLIGAGFTMRHTRSGHTGLMVVLALAMTLALFFLRNFAQVLGENGQIPVLLAAWAPPLVGMFLSLALLLHLEDG